MPPPLSVLSLLVELSLDGLAEFVRRVDARTTPGGLVFMLAPFSPVCQKPARERLPLAVCQKARSLRGRPFGASAFRRRLRRLLLSVSSRRRQLRSRSTCARRPSSRAVP